MEIMKMPDGCKHKKTEISPFRSLRGRVLFFNEINGTGYIEQESHTEKLRFTYKQIQKDGYRSVYEGQSVEYNVCKVGTGTKITSLSVIEDES